MEEEKDVGLDARIVVENGIWQRGRVGWGMKRVRRKRRENMHWKAWFLACWLDLTLMQDTFAWRGVGREIWIRSSEFVETSQKVKCWQGHWKLINGREMVRLKDAGKFLGDRVTHEIRWKSKSTLAYMWNVCWWPPCCSLLVCSFLVGLSEQRAGERSRWVSARFAWSRVREIVGKGKKLDRFWLGWEG